MRVTNLLTFMCGTKIFIQELRILDPHNNFKIIKNIPLATRNFDDINKYTDQDDLENPL